MSARRQASPRRWILALIALVVAVNLIAAAGNEIAPAPQGPPSSSYATAPEGLAAYAELLRRAGHPVRRLRSQVSDERLDARDTVVVLDPEEISQREADALRRFARAGGLLVAGGRSPSWLEHALEEAAPRWEPAGEQRFRPGPALPESARVREVRTAGEGGWDETGAGVPWLGADGTDLVIARMLGNGNVRLIADASPLQNRLLDQADNAALGLALAGEAGRRVTFVESVHGFGEQRGFSALPREWKWTLAGLALAALAFLWSQARRVGPAARLSRALPPPRSAYVDALARTLARTRRPVEAVAPVRQAARERLARRAGIGPEAGGDSLARAAELAGLPADEARAVTGTSDDIMAAGRALARLSGGTR